MPSVESGISRITGADTLTLPGSFLPAKREKQVGKFMLYYDTNKSFVY